jgi:uncharacterized membrane protein (UPF0127 family)
MDKNQEAHPMTRTDNVAMLKILIMVLLAGCTPSGPRAQGPAVPTAVIRADARPTAVLPDDTSLTLELAISDEEKSRGLMFRPSLPADRGMLFLYYDEPGDVGIWMKNTYVSLDIIFLDETGSIVSITENAPPCKADPCPTYGPGQPAHAVLEVAAGTVARHGLVGGAMIRFENVPGYPPATATVD